MSTPTKTCRYCGVEKPADHFRRNRLRCRYCAAEYQRTVMRPRHRDYYAAYSHDYYRRTRDQQLAEKKIYYQENRERIADYARRYRAANPEKIREKERRWQASNRDRRFDYKGRHRAKRWGVPFERVDFKKIVERDAFICHICGEPTDPNDLRFDHIVPFCRGGGHTEDNIAMAHQTCNLRKGTRLLSEHLARMAGSETVSM